MFSSTLLLIVISYVLLYVSWVHVIIPTFLSPLSKIPNAHWSASFNPFWMLWVRWRERENRTIHAAHVKNGSIVRLGPREVSVNSVDDGIRVIYGGGFEKWPWYENQFDNFGVPCMFSMSRSKPHSARKRMISNIYSKSYLQSSPEVHTIAKVMIFDRLLPRLESLASKQEAVDVLHMHMSTTMDMVTAFLFGLGNGSNFIQDLKAGQEWFTIYQSRRPFRFWDGELPWMKTLSKKLGFPLSPPFVAEATNWIETWVTQRCKAAQTWTRSIKEQPTDEPRTPAIVFDHLTNTVSGTAEDKSLGPPNLQIASEVQDHLAAGHETSGIALTYLYWELSRLPALQASLREELLTLSPPLKLPANKADPGLLSPRAVDSLPLLHAILMETLRIHSAIPGPQPRITPYPPVSVAGSPPLDPGIRISTQPYSLHRNADVFPDPELWRPARWLEPDEKKKAEMMKWFWAFGSGGRMCIGSHLAMQGL